MSAIEAAWKAESAEKSEPFRLRDDFDQLWFNISGEEEEAIFKMPLDYLPRAP